MRNWPAPLAPRLQARRWPIARTFEAPFLLRMAFRQELLIESQAKWGLKMSGRAFIFQVSLTYLPSYGPASLLVCIPAGPKGLGQITTTTKAWRPWELSRKELVCKKLNLNHDLNQQFFGSYEDFSASMYRVHLAIQKLDRAYSICPIEFLYTQLFERALK